jgi:hypothetical protein
LLELCPECFLLVYPRSALPEESPFKHYAGANTEENRAWVSIGREANFWLVRDTYVRAGFSLNAAVFRDENIRLFDAADGSKLGRGRKKILSDLHRFLIWDFWERLNADRDHKVTREQKIFLLQFQKVLEIAEMDPPRVLELPFVPEEDLEDMQAALFVMSLLVFLQMIVIVNCTKRSPYRLTATYLKTIACSNGQNRKILVLCAAAPQPIASPKAGLMEFRNYKNEIKTIEKEVPQWMLLLLGAVDEGLLELFEHQARLELRIQMLSRLCEETVGHESLADSLADIQRRKGQ